MSGAFSAERGQEILTRWDAIPDDTDVLITHGPPLGDAHYYSQHYPANTKHLYNIYKMLDQRRRRSADVV